MEQANPEALANAQKLDDETIITILRTIRNQNYPLLVKLCQHSGEIYKLIATANDGANKNDGTEKWFKWFCEQLFTKYLPHYNTQETAINDQIFKAHGIDKVSFRQVVMEKCQAGNKDIIHYNNQVAENFKRAVLGNVPTIKADIPEYMTKELVLECLKKSHIDFLNSHCTLFEKVLGSGEALDLKTNKRFLIAINWLSLYDHLARHFALASKGQPLNYHPLNYYMLMKPDLAQGDADFQAIDGAYKQVHAKVRGLLDQGAIDQAAIDQIKQDIAAV